MGVEPPIPLRTRPLPTVICALQERACDLDFICKSCCSPDVVINIIGKGANGQDTRFIPMIIARRDSEGSNDNNKKDQLVTRQ